MRIPNRPINRASAEAAKADTQERLAELRQAIRSSLVAGLQSHEAQDNANAVCALVDDLDLALFPVKVASSEE